VKRAILQVLNNQAGTLSEYLVKEIVLQLEDPHELVADFALYTLGGKKLEERIIQEMVSQISQLKGINPDLRQQALYMLRSKSSILKGSVLQETLSKLEDVDSLQRRSALYYLSEETNLPQHVLQAVTSRLEDCSTDVREFAVRALGNQTILSENILQALILLLEDTSRIVRDSAVAVIGNRATLPAPILQVLINRFPGFPPCVRPQVERILMKYDYFYISYPDFNTQILRSLYKSWVERSFSEQFSCYVLHGNLYINTSEGCRIISLASNMDRALRSFQSEATTLESPVCSTSFQVVIYQSEAR
jgi:hypothetical protein